MAGCCLKRARCRSRAATSCATETILDVLGADALRYFLLREIVFGQDGSFSFDALVQRYNSDLANGLGNLASRTLTMIRDTSRAKCRTPRRRARTAGTMPSWKRRARRSQTSMRQFEQYQFSRALESAWGLVAAVDKYIVENEPWALGEKKTKAAARAWRPCSTLRRRRCAS